MNTPFLSVNLFSVKWWVSTTCRADLQYKTGMKKQHANLPSPSDSNNTSCFTPKCLHHIMNVAALSRACQLAAEALALYFIFSWVKKVNLVKGRLIYYCNSGGRVIHHFRRLTNHISSLMARSVILLII